MLKENDYKESSLITQAKYSDHFWYVYRNQVIMSAILKYFKIFNRDIHIIELGAGQGNVCGYLKQQGFKVDAADMYDSALITLRDKADYAFKFNIIRDVVPDKLKGKYDLVVLADLIEHLEDPMSALKRAGAFLRKDGYILVTVPAMRILWAKYDENGGHKKRYMRKSLSQELTLSGYQIVELNYFMLIPAIIIFFERKLRSIIKKEDAVNSELSRSINFNKIMHKILKIERFLAKYISLPFGSSLIAIGRRSRLDK